MNKTIKLLNQETAKLQAEVRRTRTLKCIVLNHQLVSLQYTQNMMCILLLWISNY